MSSEEVTIVPGSTEQSPPEESGKMRWKPAAIVSDIATLGTGTMLAALINIVLVFVVPRLLSVEDYGYWRMFGLYAGYAGFVHLGLADGALLRWAGKPLEEFHREIPPTLVLLIGQHVILLVPLVLVTILIPGGALRFIGIGFVVYALILNLATVLQYALQSARIFRPVAISTVVPPGLFLIFVVAWKWVRSSTAQEVITFYILGWAISLIFLFARTKLWQREKAEMEVLRFARQCITVGWPIVLANTVAMLILYADRLAVSWGAAIQSFAQYSLAASAMAVPVTAIQASSKVFLPHLADATPHSRKRMYDISSRSLLLVWAISLPYYSALDIILHRFLPKYVPSLAYARVLLLGVPFLAAIQILQMNYAYLNGLQRSFLVRALVVLVIALGGASLIVFWWRSLVAAAAVQVVVLGLWWFVNESALRDKTAQTGSDWLKFLMIYGIASCTYWAATSWVNHSAASVAAYYLVLIIGLATTCRDELRQFGRVIRSI